MHTDSSLILILNTVVSPTFDDQILDGSSEVKSKEWKIIERVTGTGFVSQSDSIACSDSLRHTKLTSALRREAGKRLPREVLRRWDLFRSNCMGVHAVGYEYW